MYVMRLHASDAAFEGYIRTTRRLMVLLQLAFIPVVVVPLVANPGPGVSQGFEVANTAFWAVFTLDYLIRLYAVPGPRHYFLTHLADLALIALWMLPLFVIPRGADFLRATIGMRLVPLTLSSAQHLWTLALAGAARRLGI